MIEYLLYFLGHLVAVCVEIGIDFLLSEVDLPEFGSI